MPPPNSVSPGSNSPVTPAWTDADAGCDPHGACPADGLRGQLGLYEVTVGGSTRYMTRQELEQTKFGGGDDAKPVVRHDNHRELARDAVNDVMHQSVTDERLNTLLPRELGGSRGLLSPPPSRVRQEFDDRVALFGRTTTELWNFSPPGWESSNGNPAACFKLACQGAQQTAGKGESPVGGGGVILYEKVAQRIKTDADASRLALSQIKEHIDAGKSVVAGVNEPGQGHVVDVKKQPVTDHFVAVSGYETDSSGRVTALLAKDNATSKATDIRFEVRADGSIFKPADPKHKDEYLRQEYQLSEVRFHSSMPYTGSLKPTNDVGQNMAWSPKS